MCVRVSPVLLLLVGALGEVRVAEPHRDHDADQSERDDEDDVELHPLPDHRALERARLLLKLERLRRVPRGAERRRRRAFGS